MKRFFMSNSRSVRPAARGKREARAAVVIRSGDGAVHLTGMFSGPAQTVRRRPATPVARPQRAKRRVASRIGSNG